MANILAIDDDIEILNVIKLALERQGHRVDTVTSTKEVTDEKARFADLILLDVMMPDEDGFAYCERIRDMVDCPIIFLTAKTAETDLIHGLGLGADDYIQKPFSIGELRARVLAHIRRETREHKNVIKSGNFKLDLNEKEVYFGNSLINLTKSQYAICAHLIQHSGQVFSKEQIYESVFGFDGESDESAIVEHIKNIRSKFKAVDAEPIKTVWGIGYKWIKEKE